MCSAAGLSSGVPDGAGFLVHGDRVFGIDKETCT